MTKSLIVIGLAILAACGDGKPQQKTESGCTISDYGRGVFYFHCSYGFGEALAEFRVKHHIVTVTSFAAGQYGTSGYWVVAE